MTKPKPKYVCDECKHEGGWHTLPSNDPAVPDRIVRCPQYLATVQQQNAQQLAADAHVEAFKAAKQIIADAAETMPEFSANQIRDRLDGIDSPVIGAAFSASIRAGVIEATGRTVPSTDPGTHGHRIYVYKSLCYRGSAA